MNIPEEDWIRINSEFPSAFEWEEDGSIVFPINRNVWWSMDYIPDSTRPYSIISEFTSKTEQYKTLDDALAALKKQMRQRDKNVYNTTLVFNIVAQELKNRNMEIYVSKSDGRKDYLIIDVKLGFFAGDLEADRYGQLSFDLNRATVEWKEEFWPWNWYRFEDMEDVDKIVEYVLDKKAKCGVNSSRGAHDVSNTI